MENVELGFDPGRPETHEIAQSLRNNKETWDLLGRNFRKRQPGLYFSYCPKGCTDPKGRLTTKQRMTSCVEELDLDSIFHYLLNLAQDAQPQVGDCWLPPPTSHNCLWQFFFSSSRQLKYGFCHISLNFPRLLAFVALIAYALYLNAIQFQCS